MLKKYLFLLLFIPFLAFGAEEAAEGEESEEKKLPLKYYQIAPNIMTFYQGTGKKMGYVVVQVQVVVRGEENLELVGIHLPLMQDALIDFFNRQEKKVIRDHTQRPTLQNQAKEKVAAALKEELGEDIIEDLLFTQYIFQ